MANWDLQYQREQVDLLQGPKEFGELKADQVKRLKDLETENAGLCKWIADLTR